jgi:hypothetical protein
MYIIDRRFMGGGGYSMKKYSPGAWNGPQLIKMETVGLKTKAMKGLCKIAWHHLATPWNETHIAQLFMQCPDLEISCFRRVTKLEVLTVPVQCTMYCTNINIREVLLNLSVLDLAALFVCGLFLQLGFFPDFLYLSSISPEGNCIESA